MHKTNSMKDYNSCKENIKKLKKKISELEKTKTTDLNKIKNEYKKSLTKIKENYKIETKIDLLNAQIIIPT